MISRLHGVLLEKTPPSLLVDVQGVGYEVFAPMSTFYQLPDINSQLTLHTHFVVREDAQQLYGFFNVADRELFRTLIKVNGVGPKMALGMMSGMESNQLAECVHGGNIAALTRIPGIGKKTAERLVVELRDKLAVFATRPGSAANTVALTAGDALGDAEVALVALGYKPAEAARLVGLARKNKPDANSQELIRHALRAAVNV